jgi:hypothetical protein
MAPCIIDFIGANGICGPVGGRGPWTLLGPSMATSEASAILCNRGRKVNPGPILLCCVGDVLEISTGWVGWGGGGLTGPRQGCQMAVATAE